MKKASVCVALCCVSHGYAQTALPPLDAEPLATVQVRAEIVTPATDPFGFAHLLGELLDDFDVIHLAGDASGFAFPVHSADGANNIYYTPSAPEWDQSSQRGCIGSPDPLAPAVRQLNQTTVTRIPPSGGPGTEHRIMIRSWASSNGSVIAPSIPSGCFTYTVPGFNDDLGIPITSRHPTSYGVALGGIGSNGLCLTPSWDRSLPVTGSVVLLGFRSSDLAFVGLTPVDDNGNTISPTFQFIGERLVMEPLVVRPSALASNPVTALPDLSTAVGPFTWFDGISDTMVIHAVQINLVAFEGASVCRGDFADSFGFTADEGGGPDGVVDFGDFVALLGLIGPCDGGVPGCLGDIADDFGTLCNTDGVVDFGDFVALLGLIGPCP